MRALLCFTLHKAGLQPPAPAVGSWVPLQEGKEGAGASPGLSERVAVKLTHAPRNVNYASTQSTEFNLSGCSPGWVNRFGVMYPHKEREGLVLVLL